MNGVWAVIFAGMVIGFFMLTSPNTENLSLPFFVGSLLNYVFYVDERAVKWLVG